MRERDIEAYLRRRVADAGGMAIKLNPLSFAGVPDRVVILRGVVVFVELKAPGKEPTPLQLTAHARLRAAGATVYVVDSKKGCDEIINAICR